jgi:hypothetical protein
VRDYKIEARRTVTGTDNFHVADVSGCFRPERTTRRTAVDSIAMAIRASRVRYGQIGMLRAVRLHVDRLLVTLCPADYSVVVQFVEEHRKLVVA